MHQVLWNNNIIFDLRAQAGADPGSAYYAAYDASLRLGVGEAGSLSFTLPAGHPYAGQVTPRVGVVKVVDLDEDETVFLGRVLSDTQNLDGSHSYECEGRMACLNDTVMTPYAFPDAYVTDPAYTAAVANNTVPAYWLGKLLELHNSMAWTTDKRISLGTVTVTGGTFARSNEGWQSMWSTITGDLPESPLGGYLVPRYVGDTMYLDYLSSFNTELEQSASLSINLVDFARTVDSSNYFNALIPVGEDDLTCAAAPNGSYGSHNQYYKSGVYLVTPDERDAGYGNVVRTVKFEGVTTAAELVAAAVAYLDAMSHWDIGKVSAADLAGVDGSSVPPFRIGKLLRVVVPPQGISATYPIIGLTVDLTDPVGTQIELGRKGAAISGSSGGDGSVPSSGPAAGAVTGVKGNAENAYRTGDVNLTPANIGAVNKAGDTMTGSLGFQSGGDTKSLTYNRVSKPFMSWYQGASGIVLENQNQAGNGISRYLFFDESSRHLLLTDASWNWIMRFVPAPEVLWTNPSPQNPMANGDLTSLGDISGYNFFCVEICYSASYRTVRSGIWVYVDGTDPVVAHPSISWYGSTEITVAFREVWFTLSNPAGSQVWFDKGNRVADNAGYTEDNSYAIPTRIIGMKI